MMEKISKVLCLATKFTSQKNMHVKHSQEYASQLNIIYLSEPNDHESKFFNDYYC